MFILKQYSITRYVVPLTVITSPTANELFINNAAIVEKQAAHTGADLGQGCPLNYIRYA